MKPAFLAAAALVVVLAAFPGAYLAGRNAAPHAVHAAAAEQVCVINRAHGFISDRTIRNDIPAWEHALNVNLAGFWHTARYHIRLIGRRDAPSGCVSMVFQNKGPVKGALAYHWTERNDLPSITVYAATGKYYGYDNSVSATHELEEMAADPVASYLNVGYPSGYYWLEKNDTSLRIEYQTAVGWFSEISDPVESDSYTLPGRNGKPVKVSDFVTPAWFNDGVGMRFDFMGLCQQPFWIRPGGYAQYLDQFGWQIVENFRTGHPADRGFFLGDPRGSRA